MRLSRRILSVFALVIVAVLVVAWSALRPGEAPNGQPPLVILDSSSLEALRADFNRDSNLARIIVLLAPT